MYNNDTGIGATSGNDITTCNSIYNCSQSAILSSQTAIPIISPIISCVKDMILRLVVSTEVCDPNAVVLNIQATGGSAAAAKITGGPSMLNQFQSSMQQIVIALLTLYVMFFGIKMAIGAGGEDEEELKAKDMIMFVIKFIVVTYFSIGINMNTTAGPQRFDGISQIVFPFMLNGITEIASWMMGAASINGLCSFPNSLYSATADINMSLWDQIDCRLAYYIGYDGLMELVMMGANDPVYHSVPPYMVLIPIFIYFGLPSVALMLLSYPLMIISYVAYAICLYINSLILILILGIMAPIFVPMALFDYTKNYFENWYKNLFSLMLQPAVSLVFLSICFAVYDRAFYGTCIYSSTTVHYNNSTSSGFFNVNVQNNNNALNTPRSFITFFISEDPNDYASQNAIENCKTSLGFFLGNGVLKPTNGSSLDINPQDPSIIASIPNKDIDYLNGQNGRPKLTWQPGLSVNTPNLIIQDVMQLMLNIIISLIMLTCIKHLMDSISGFISSITGGSIQADSTLGASTIMNTAISYAKDTLEKRQNNQQHQNKKDDKKGEDSAESTVKAPGQAGASGGAGASVPPAPV
jgi:type IV secretion system protein VirB6